MKQLLLDLKYAWRRVVRTRTATLAAVLSLALGIGANVSMLDSLDVLFFRPPAHVEHPENLRRLYFLASPGSAPSEWASYPDFVDLRSTVSSFAALAAFDRFDVPVGRGSSERQLPASVVSASFWSTLGVTPALGRFFTEAESAPGRPGTLVVVSYEFWQRSFGGSPAVIGERLWIGRDPYTILGVLPKGFSGIDLEASDLWLPLNALARLRLSPEWSQLRSNALLQAVARLRPHTGDVATAREATAVYRRASDPSGRQRERVLLAPLQRAWGPGASLDSQVSVWLSGISFAVLLIACANVVSLLVVREISLRRELAMRFALGASRWQVIRLLAAETVILSLMGGAGALALLFVGKVFTRAYLLPEGVVASGLDGRSLGLLAASIAGALLLCGLPSVFGGRRIRGTIDAGARLGNATRSRLRAGMLALQVAFTLVLLVGAGLFIRSLEKARHLDLGLDTNHLLVGRIDFEQATLTKTRIDEIYRRALARVHRLPGVENASLTSSPPFVEAQMLDFAAPGAAVRGDGPGNPLVSAVAAGYFTTVGIRLRNGRLFDDTAGREGKVAVVNRAMANRLWPQRGALGQCIRVGSAAAPCTTVIGVVNDSHQLKLREAPLMQYYLPLSQANESLSADALLVLAGGEARALAGAVRREMRAEAPASSFVEVHSLSELLAPQLHPWSLGAVLFSLFGLLGLVLAVIGLHGVVSFTIQQRFPELGVRIALGAQWRAIFWVVMREGLRMVGLGVVIGLFLVLEAGQLVQSLLFDTQTADLLAVGGAVSLLAGVTGGASLLSTWRVRRIDPATVLRAE